MGGHATNMMAYQPLLGAAASFRLMLEERRIVNLFTDSAAKLRAKWFEHERVAVEHDTIVSDTAPTFARTVPNPSARRAKGLPSAMLRFNYSRFQGEALEPRWLTPRFFASGSLYCRCSMNR
jgi:hypothetical protein